MSNDDFFGSALAALGDLDGDLALDLAVGSAGEGDHFIYGSHGAAWILFQEPDSTVAAEQEIGADAGGLADTLEVSDFFGSAVVSLGDLDGDGVEELAVGAPSHGGLGGDVGSVWILFLQADGTVKSHREISAGKGGFGGTLTDGDLFGSALAALGDLDGDGDVDLAAGAPGDGHGCVWILYLEPDGTVEGQSRIFRAMSLFGFGSALAPLGDLDDDGTCDLAVGAPGTGSGFGNTSGEVWVLFLEPDGTLADSQRINSSEGGFVGTLVQGDVFGASLAALGDLDGDGVGDLAVGAPFFNPFDDDEGAVWVLYLNPDGTVHANHRISAAEGGFAGELDFDDRFGSALAALGDLDGDGIVDLAVGAPSDDDGAAPDQLEIQRGAMWLLFLNADGRVGSHAKISATEGGLGAGRLDRWDGFGSAAALLGDLDGDGIRDLAVGAAGDDDGGSEHGAVWLLALDGIAALEFETEDDLTTPLVNGQAVSTPSAFGTWVAVSSAGANAGAAIFDSAPGGPNDPSQDRDLLVDLGNLLVLQNSQAPNQTVPGIFDRPNDDQDGGLLVFDFEAPVEAMSVILVDIDHGNEQASGVTLLDGAGRSRVFTVPPRWTEDLLADGPPAWRRLDLTQLDPQQGFLSLATAGESPGFDPLDVVRVEVRLGSSGGVDSLLVDPHP